MVEIDRFPAIVMHRARGIRLGPRHHIITDVPLERRRASVQPSVRHTEQKRCRFKSGALPLRACRMAPLDVAATIRQFFGQHDMATWPPVMHAKSDALGVCACLFAEKRKRWMLVPRTACTRLAFEYSGLPRLPFGLELTNPTPCKVANIARLRSRQHRRGQMVKHDWLVRR